MRRVLHVAKTEIIEHRRQPSMIFILGFNYVFWCSIFTLAILVLAWSAQAPEVQALLDQQGAALGICDGDNALETLLRLTTSTFGAVLFTNLPLFVAIMSGYSVLHDRDTGALPFLMLAPLSRYQLLAGKLIGALAIPTLLHLIFVGFTTFFVGNLPIMAPYAEKLGGSGGWWVAFLFGAPASGFFVGSIGTVISGLSKDVRTSMQFTSFTIGILSLGFGAVLFDGISWGVAAQAGFVAGCILGGMLILMLGSRVISRDI